MSSFMTSSSSIQRVEREPVKEETSRGKIFNSVEPIVVNTQPKEVPVSITTPEPTPVVTSVTNDDKKIIIDDTQDDDWGAVPAFLRRSKLK